MCRDRLLGNVDLCKEFGEIVVIDDADIKMIFVIQRIHHFPQSPWVVVINMIMPMAEKLSVSHVEVEQSLLQFRHFQEMKFVAPISLGLV